MKIVAVSDSHGFDFKIPECDLLIHCGDISPAFDHGYHFQRQWFRGHWIQFLKNLPAKQIVFIGGNHDHYLSECNRNKIEHEIYEVLPENVTYLRDSEVTIGDLSIWGYPWTPKFGWTRGFMDKDHLLRVHQLKIPENIDILVSHGPPYMTCDWVEEDSQHVGSQSLREILPIIKPRYVFCGHIHSGMHEWNDGVRNVSLVNEEYRMVYEPFVMEIE